MTYLSHTDDLLLGILAKKQMLIGPARDPVTLKVKAQADFNAQTSQVYHATSGPLALDAKRSHTDKIAKFCCLVCASRGLNVTALIRAYFKHIYKRHPPKAIEARCAALHMCHLYAGLSTRKSAVMRQGSSAPGHSRLTGTCLLYYRGPAFDSMHRICRWMEWAIYS